MSTLRSLAAIVLLLVATSPLAAQLADANRPTVAGKPYEKLATRQATREGMLRSLVGVSVEWGDWHVLAPIAHPRGGKDIATPYAPESLLQFMRPAAPALDMMQPVILPDGSSQLWRPIAQRQDIGGLGGLLPVDLRDGVPQDRRTNQVGYLYRTVRVDAPTDLPVSVGSDDGVRMWLNGDLVLDVNAERPLDPGAHHLTLSLQPGLNHLLVKISQGGGEWAFQLSPTLNIDPVFEAALDYQLDSDFPDPESVHYRIITIPVPAGIEAEVGGLDILPKGDDRPILCTRRGEMYIVDNAYERPVLDARWNRFASGLQEPLGVSVRLDGAGRAIWAAYVAQRSELTRIIDTNADGIADRFETLCADWSISGNYHEYAFGPKFDRDGHAWVTLNLAHTGGETVMGTTIPTRGWAVKISPDGAMHKVADGLRSPDGVGMFSDGQMFYTDNQGDYIATCKLSPLYEGSFHGHQASLRFRDGWADWKKDGKPLPEITPPAVWFPYQKMGQSASDIILDASGGLFGPFDGQLFVGDQTHATLMRVFLEKPTDENGKAVYQGACFPFRKGFASGVHRMAWGADGSMFVGMTDRGWGSTGPKRFGLQRLVYTGVEPFEIKQMRAVPDGFELEFTDRPRPDSMGDPASYSLSSYTYLYRPDYGSPEVQTEPRRITSVKRINDRTVRLVVDQMKPGFVYELDAPGVRTMRAPESPLLHSKAYYTLNIIPREPSPATGTTR